MKPFSQTIGFAVLLAASPLLAQTFTFNGMLVPTSMPNVEHVRLRFHGIGPSGNLQPLGERLVRPNVPFTQELPAAVSQFKINIVNLDSSWAIIYPPSNQVLAKPADQRTITFLVLAKAEESRESLLLDALAAYEHRVRTALERAVDNDSLLRLQAGIGDELRGLSASVLGVKHDTELILEKLELQQQQYEAALARKYKQADYLPQIERVIERYVIAAKDLRTDFLLLANQQALRADARMVFDALQQSVLAYNVAFDSLNSSKESMVKLIDTYWKKDDADRVAEYAQRFFTLAKKMHDEHVLSLNEWFVKLQSQYARRGARENQVIEQSIMNIERIVNRMEGMLTLLDTEKASILGALQKG